MFNTDMFKDAFVIPKAAAPAARAPVPLAPAPVQYEDPEVAKLRFLMLKWLSIIIGGSAILLIVWRVILKFF